MPQMMTDREHAEESVALMVGTKMAEDGKMLVGDASRLGSTQLDSDRDTVSAAPAAYTAACASANAAQLLAPPPAL